jgi:hypothetical protein
MRGQRKSAAQYAMQCDAVHNSDYEFFTIQCAEDFSSLSFARRSMQNLLLLLRYRNSLSSHTESVLLGSFVITTATVKNYFTMDAPPSTSNVVLCPLSIILRYYAIPSHLISSHCLPEALPS